MKVYCIVSVSMYFPIKVCIDILQLLTVQNPRRPINCDRPVSLVIPLCRFDPGSVGYKPLGD